ncbi:MAG: hypothetical protein HOP33_06615 [Verrucomicrobia bacterium]|nr:hypothetical protein [Verrucomicrobiota bacterium]
MAAGEFPVSFSAEIVEERVVTLHMETFTKKFVRGEATLKDFIDWLGKIPPVLCERFSQQPGGEIFKPENVNLVKELQHVVNGPVNTPEESVDAACARLVLSVGFGADIVRTAAAFFNIHQSIVNQKPLLPGSLEEHDKHFFAATKLSRTTHELSPVLAERQSISVRTKDKFLTRWRRMAKKSPELRPLKLLDDLPVDRLRKLLLSRWLEVLPGRPTKIGLCDFTYDAIVEFICDYYEAADDTEFNYQSVYDAIRRPPLQLLQRKPSTVTSCAVDKTSHLIHLTHDGSKVSHPVS